MDRRNFLIRGGVAIGCATLLGGCTEQRLEEAKREPEAVDDFYAEEEVPLPVDQKLGIGADGVRTAEGVEIADIEALEEFLEERGFAVEKIEEEVVEHEPIVSLEYVVTETIDRGLMHHLGIVAGGYATLVAAGDESEKLEASLFQPDGKKFGEYEVRHHWAEEYNAGELSAKEYVGEVLESAKSR